MNGLKKLRGRRISRNAGGEGGGGGETGGKKQRTKERLHFLRVLFFITIIFSMFHVIHGDGSRSFYFNFYIQEP